MKTLSIVFITALMLLVSFTVCKNQLRKSKVNTFAKLRQPAAPTVEQMETESDLNEDSEEEKQNYPPVLAVNSTLADIEANRQWVEKLETKTDDALSAFNRRVKRFARSLLLVFRSLAGRRMTVQDFLDLLRHAENGDVSIPSKKAAEEFEKYGYKNETELRTRNFAHLFRKWYYSVWVAQKQLGSDTGFFLTRLTENVMYKFIPDIYTRKN